MAGWYDIQSDFHRSNDNWWRKFVKGLNNAFNPYHAWFDYDKWNEPTLLDKAVDSIGTLIDHVANPDVATSLVDKYTGAHLTGAELEANAFSAEEAQKSRDFTEYMARNKYSMETESMQNAGVNPAMVYGGGSLVPTAANGAAAHSVAPQAGDIGNLIMSIVRMPAEMAKLRSEASKADKEGEAALKNAESNRIMAEASRTNAGTGQGELKVHEREVAVQEARVGIEQTLADNNTRATDAQVSKWAEEEAYTHALIEWLPTEVNIRKTHANAAQTSAYAAVQQAKAAQQNADTNSKLSDSQVILNTILGQKEAIYRDYLPAELSAKIDEMKARGYYFNEQGKLVDKQGRLVDAQVAREYVGLACDVARTACQVAGTVATAGAGGVLVKGESGPAPASVPQYHDYSLGTYGTYGD